MVKGIIVSEVKNLWSNLKTLMGWLRLSGSANGQNVTEMKQMSFKLMLSTHILKQKAKFEDNSCREGSMNKSKKKKFKTLD